MTGMPHHKAMNLTGTRQVIANPLCGPHASETLRRRAVRRGRLRRWRLRQRTSVHALARVRRTGPGEGSNHQKVINQALRRAMSEDAELREAVVRRVMRAELRARSSAPAKRRAVSAASRQLLLTKWPPCGEQHKVQEATLQQDLCRWAEQTFLH